MTERSGSTKRLVFAFDGTWNRIDGENPTNVTRLAQSVSHYDSAGRPQLIYYDEGVGTSATERLSGGIFGRGLQEKIIHAYHFLVMNYQPGDQIYVFGFSRGAFTARSFVGLIRNCGIISRRSLTHIRAAVEMYVNRDENAKPNSESALQFRLTHCPDLMLPGDLEWRSKAFPDRVSGEETELRIEYLGIWDTVGALGVPGHLRPLAFLNRHHQFHDTKLSSVVLRARHALSADEMRRSFEPSLWSNLEDLNGADPEERRYEQMIFPGVHSGVGGGGPVRGLCDFALEWVFKGARAGGLQFDLDERSPIFGIRPDHRAALFNAVGKVTWSLKDRAMGVGLGPRAFPEMDRRAIHPAVARRYATPADQLPERKPYRPAALKNLWPTLQSMADQLESGLEADKSRLGDPRALRSPTRARSYTIRPGDTLRSIAESEMGSADDAPILALHNRNVQLLFEDEALYAGNAIEIPEYVAGDAVAAVPQSNEKSA